MIVTMKKRVTAKHKVVTDRRKDVHIFYQQLPSFLWLWINNCYGLINTGLVGAVSGEIG